jgi:hypothetical protein
MCEQAAMGKYKQEKPVDLVLRGRGIKGIVFEVKARENRYFRSTLV